MIHRAAPPPLIAALEKRGVDRTVAEHLATEILQHRLDLFYWNDTYKERIALHAFKLTQARSQLQDWLARDPNPIGREVLEQCIREIDEHFSAHQWPTNLSEDDPALLYQMWQQQSQAQRDAHVGAEDDARSPRLAFATAETRRILRSALKVAVADGVDEGFDPVRTETLTVAFQRETDWRIRAIIADELQQRLPVAADYLSALHGHRPVARLARLIDLKRMSSAGFLTSIVQTEGELSAVVDNLTIIKRAIGKDELARITGAWHTLEKIKCIAVRASDIRGIDICGYHLDYPVKYSSSQMPPWMKDNAVGELRQEDSGEAGFYFLFQRNFAQRETTDSIKAQLREQYSDIKNNLIKPNYDALQLIVAHSDKMTKRTALAIVSLLAAMVRAYHQVASPSKGDAVLAKYESLCEGLEQAWDDLSPNEELPTPIRQRITRLVESPLSDIDSVHSFIRYLHEAGNRALEERLASAHADVTIAFGRLGAEPTQEVRIARLDDEPIVVNGLIRHRTVRAIVQAAGRHPNSIPGTLVVTANHIIHNVRLGEHQVEFAANLQRPEDEGFVRLQCYQGGAQIEQRLRGAFLEAVLKHAGMTVQTRQEGLVDWLVSGALDKDHGARSLEQIERLVVLLLRLIWSLRDLDFAMLYIAAQRAPSATAGRDIPPEELEALAAPLAMMFVLEGRIALPYQGEGIPLAAYCEHIGPAVLQQYDKYLGEEQRMIRHRLYFTLNAALEAVGLPVIKPSPWGVGQATIDEYFSHPIREAVGRGELTVGQQGFVKRNPRYHPVADVVGSVVADEDRALRVAALLKSADLDLEFVAIGSIDQLTVVRAQQELAPREWLVVYGLSDDEYGAVLYAFCQYSRIAGKQDWLSLADVSRLLRRAGFSVPAAIRVSGFQKIVSHRKLVSQPAERSKIVGTSIRGLPASVGDGSVRLGRITLDRNYSHRPNSGIGSVLLVPFTSPEDIEAIRCAAAVLVTSGGLLSHAAVTTREFAIPALILPHAEWLSSPEGTLVRLGDRRPAAITKSAAGFWVSDSLISESVEVREGDVALVWASQNMVSIISMRGDFLEHTHDLVQCILDGTRSFIELEDWLENISIQIEKQGQRERTISDILSLVVAESLWDRRVSFSTREQFMGVLRHICAGVRADGAPLKVPTKSVAHLNLIVKRLIKRTFGELEALLSETEGDLAKVQSYWRALNIIEIVERQWARANTLVNGLSLSIEQRHALGHRIEQLRRHPRVTLLKASALERVVTLARRDLKPDHLPLIRQTLRRAGLMNTDGRCPMILFVCTTNVDRSPMAEYLFKKMLQERGIIGVGVRSCGVAAPDDRPISAMDRAILWAEEEIDTDGHSSKKVDETLVRQADVVLAMERFHVQSLKSSFGFAAPKIFLLSEYSGMLDIGDIEDPAGQPAEGYYRMKREITLCLLAALKRMTEEGILARAMTAYLHLRAGELAKNKRAAIAGSQRALLALSEVDADALALVGGKGANLGEIASIVRQHGAQVPTACVVTTFAFQRFLQENGLIDAHASVSAAIDAILRRQSVLGEEERKEIIRLSKQIRKLILQGRLDGDTALGREIMAHVDACGLRSAHLSVRSSGLQEDTEEATFAGAAETYLYVGADELLDRIKSVWMSFWLIRGLLYRNTRVVPQGSIKPAVIVQEMFDSQVSGVMFTTDPVSGRDVIVIEAGYGLGEGVVSGLVDVDRYYINKFDGSIIDMHIGKKAFKVVPHRSGKGTAIEPVDTVLRAVPCLRKEDIRVKVAMALEEHYALSQDIEFGINGGTFAVLQARPVSARGFKEIVH